MQTEVVERNGQKVAIIRFPEQGYLRRSDISDDRLTDVVKGLPLDCDLLINCGELYFVDSFGIGEILASYLIFRERQRRLILAAVSPKLLLNFRTTMLDKVIEIVPDEETALSVIFGDKT